MVPSRAMFSCCTAKSGACPWAMTPSWKVLLMRVDSDEFRALMAVPEPKLRGQI